MSLRATGNEGGFRFAVADDGVGGPSAGRDGGVGRRLVAGLARQLEATLREEVTPKGRTVVLDVPPPVVRRQTGPRQGWEVAEAPG